MLRLVKKAQIVAALLKGVLVGKLLKNLRDYARRRITLINRVVAIVFFSCAFLLLLPYAGPILFLEMAAFCTLVVLSD